MYCNHNSECHDQSPTGKDSHCSKIEYGAFNENGIRFKGVCAPTKCIKNEASRWPRGKCLEIGDYCKGGAIHGDCYDNRCNYRGYIKFRRNCVDGQPVTRSTRRYSYELLK